VLKLGVQHTRPMPGTCIPGLPASLKPSSSARHRAGGELALALLRVHHIGLAVEDLDKALGFFSGVLGLEVEKTVVVEEQDMRAAWLRLGDLWLELMEPLSPEGPVGRFLAKRGEGIHHVAVLVDDMMATCEELKRAGIRLVYEEPRRGHDGALYNFIHPKAAHGVLLELRQEPGG